MQQGSQRQDQLSLCGYYRGGINSIDFPPVPDNSELCELNQEEAQWKTGRCF